MAMPRPELSSPASEHLLPPAPHGAPAAGAAAHARHRFSPPWFVVQASFMVAPAISNTLILPLLIPPRVEQLVGGARKAAALGAITSFTTVIQASPLDVNVIQTPLSTFH
jgi:hypothetical protein